MTKLNLTDAEIESLWDAGNNAGKGFAVGEAGMSPRQAAEAEGYINIRTFDTRNYTSHCVVACDIDDSWVAICDANGPWAVVITTESLPVLHELADHYGADTPLDYVSDLWGSEPCQMTPTEAIEMHTSLNWRDNAYSIRRYAQPGEPVLVDGIGNPILVMPQEVE